MTQLRALSLHFLPYPPAETSLDFLHHQRNVLFSLLSRASNIEELASTWTLSWPESMRLVSWISISPFFSQLTMDASQLGRFIDQLEPLKSPGEANIESSMHAISISIIHKRQVAEAFVPCLPRCLPSSTGSKTVTVSPLYHDGRQQYLYLIAMVPFVRIVFLQVCTFELGHSHSISSRHRVVALSN